MDRRRQSFALMVLAAALISSPARPNAAQQQPTSTALPDFDIREQQAPLPPRVAGAPTPSARAPQRLRLNRETGTLRILDHPGTSVGVRAGIPAIRAALVQQADALGLQPNDLTTLSLVRDYTTRSNNVRHAIFRQVVDGIPVFDSMIGVHLHPDGRILRIASNAAPVAGRAAGVAVASGRARSEAARHASGTVQGTSTLVWLPLNGELRLAWLSAVTADATADVYDVLVDATNAQLLLRRNRVRQVDVSGRVLQSSSPADPRRPDPMPFGVAGALGCPPAINYSLRDLATPFRDPATVLGPSGRLEGNNVRVFRGSTAVPSASGTLDGDRWVFDFPFNAPASAETFLFFAMNFAHDFFYDLGFDEAAGNFQAENFGRGGVGGDPVKANARAAGRNNANYVHAADGASPTINMFLWDGSGCWGEDVTDDGIADLDGDYDLDIIVHEFHHGVSLRLNTAFTGNEAGAIGEGGGDFFAYSVNGDSVLAEYARPGGLRQVNGKGYGDWTCLLGILCEVHDNGEIWANVLWDVRERFRSDLVRGTETAAIAESHQLYFDGLTLSPPAPTMLDMRDAMLLADEVRNPEGSRSEHFCRLWESFAGRGMGVSASDTADNGFNRVVAAYDVPAGCTPPPAPPTVTIAVTRGTAREAGLLTGSVTISRGVVEDRSLSVNYFVGGTAVPGNDYQALPGVATIPPGAADVAVSILPIDDNVVESNESVTLTLTSGSAYVIGTPAPVSVTIVSDDVAPDLTVSTLTAPSKSGAGLSISVTDTTRNQGTGAAAPSSTTFFLSANSSLDAGDPQIGSRTVPALAPGDTSTAVSTMELPPSLTADTYFLIAKVDAAGALVETNEFNNTRLTTIGIGPDLVVTAISGPAAAAAGASISVTDTTANQGGGSSSASETRFFLSANSVLDAADRPLPQARSIQALAPGQASTGTTTVTLPTVATGTYYLFAQADAPGVVAEASDSNNSRLTTIRIGPDLTISALSAPNRAAAGGSIAVSDTTRNAGAGAAPSSRTAFYLSTNFSLDATDIPLEPSRPVGPLAANAVSSSITTVTLPNVAAGSWFLLANADDGEAVPETQETNNVRFVSLLIGPDLTFSGMSSPGTAAAGASISVTTVVRNAGAGSAGASTVRFYLSTNSSFDAGDLALPAQREVPGLAPDTSHSTATAVPLPGDRSGSFFLIAVADADAAVAESSELNNVTVRALQITP